MNRTHEIDLPIDPLATQPIDMQELVAEGLAKPGI